MDENQGAVVINEESGSWAKSAYEWMEAAIFSLVMVVLVFTFLFRTVGVKGSSMVDTLHDGERLLVTSFPYTPERGDIVIINRNDEESHRDPLVKRIIATGGETVKIDPETGAVSVDGNILDEPYINNMTNIPPSNQMEWTVPEHCVFVMGDNRQGSSDSREMGFFEENRIVGKVFMRIFPFNKFGAVE